MGPGLSRAKRELLKLSFFMKNIQIICFLLNFLVLSALFGIKIGIFKNLMLTCIYNYDTV